MAGFPITLPDGSTVNIVRKDGAEAHDERFTDENGNVYMKNLSGGMSRSFVLVKSGAQVEPDDSLVEEASEAEQDTLIGFEGEEPSVDEDVQPITEDEEADGGEVITISFEDGDEAQVEPESDFDFDLHPEEDPPLAA